MTENSGKILKNIAYVLLFTAIFAVTFCFFSGGTVFSTDFLRLIGNFPNFSARWLYCEDGAFLATLFTNLSCFNFLSILHIHPNVVIFSEIIKSASVVLLTFLISRFLYFGLGAKKSGIHCFLSVFLFFAFLVFIGFDIFYEKFFINIYFFKNLFMLLFYLGFWLYLYKNFLKNENSGKIVRISMILVGFAAGYSNFWISFSALFSLVIFLAAKSLWQGFRLKFNIRKILLINFVKKRKKTIKFFEPIIAFLCGFSSLVVTPSLYHCIEIAEFRFSPDLWKNSINGFLHVYSDFFSLNVDWNILTVGIFVLTFFAVFFKSNIKSLILAWSMYLGNVIFLFLFAFPLVKSDEYGFINSDFFLGYVIISLTTILILFGALYSIPKNKNLRNITIVVFLLFLQFFSFDSFWTEFGLTVPYEIKQYKMFKSVLKEYRQNTYIAEKMMVFYEKKSQPAYIYTAFTKTDIEGGNVEFENFKNYFNGIHKFEVSVPVNIVSKGEAEKRFKKSGGILTEKEIKNPDFNKLLDEDFVLGKSDKKTEK